MPKRRTPAADLDRFLVNRQPNVGIRPFWRAKRTIAQFDRLRRHPAPAMDFNIAGITARPLLVRSEFARDLDGEHGPWRNATTDGTEGEARLSHAAACS